MVASFIPVVLRDAIIISASNSDNCVGSALQPCRSQLAQLKHSSRTGNDPPDRICVRPWVHWTALPPTNGAYHPHSLLLYRLQHNNPRIDVGLVLCRHVAHLVPLHLALLSLMLRRHLPEIIPMYSALI
eukprot:Opistho-2@57549